MAAVAIDMHATQNFKFLTGDNNHVGAITLLLHHQKKILHSCVDKRTPSTPS